MDMRIKCLSRSGTSSTEFYLNSIKIFENYKSYSIFTRLTHNQYRTGHEVRFENHRLTISDVSFRRITPNRMI